MEDVRPRGVWILLKIREDIQRTPIEVTTKPSDVADEQQFLFTQEDNENDTEEQTPERKEQLRHNSKQWLANEEQTSLKISVRAL